MSDEKEYEVDVNIEFDFTLNMMGKFPIKDLKTKIKNIIEEHVKSLESVEEESFYFYNDNIEVENLEKE